MLVAWRGKLARSLERVWLGRLGVMRASFAACGKFCHMQAQAGAVDFQYVALRAAMLASSGFCRIEGREVDAMEQHEAAALASRSASSLPLIPEWPGTHLMCTRRWRRDLQRARSCAWISSSRY